MRTVVSKFIAEPPLKTYEYLRRPVKSLTGINFLLFASFVQVHGIGQGFSTFILSFTPWQMSKVKFTPQIFYICTSTNACCIR